MYENPHMIGHRVIICIIFINIQHSESSLFNTTITHTEHSLSLYRRCIIIDWQNKTSSFLPYDRQFVFQFSDENSLCIVKSVYQERSSCVKQLNGWSTFSGWSSWFAHMYFLLHFALPSLVILIALHFIFNICSI